MRYYCSCTWYDIKRRSQQNKTQGNHVERLRRPWTAFVRHFLAASSQCIDWRSWENLLLTTYSMHYYSVVYHNTVELEMFLPLTGATGSRRYRCIRLIAVSSRSSTSSRSSSPPGQTLLSYTGWYVEVGMIVVVVVRLTMRRAIGVAYAPPNTLRQTTAVRQTTITTTNNNDIINSYSSTTLYVMLSRP